jgi:hypothetical protein
MGNSGSTRALEECSFCFLDHAHNLLQVFLANLAGLDEMNEERLG